MTHQEVRHERLIAAKHGNLLIRQVARPEIVEIEVQPWRGDTIRLRLTELEARDLIDELYRVVLAPQMTYAMLPSGGSTP